MEAIPRMNWSAKDGARSSLHYGDEGVSIHPSHQGVCRRYGKEDKWVTHGEPCTVQKKKGKSCYKGETEMDDEAVQGVGELNSTLTIEKQKQ